MFSPLSISLFICLSTGLCKSYKTDFYETLGRDGTEAKKEPVK